MPPYPTNNRSRANREASASGFNAAYLPPDSSGDDTASPTASAANSDAFMPTLRRKSMADPYGLDNSPSQDEIISSDNPGAANVYKPTLGGATPPASPVQPSQPNPYAARLTDLGNQLQSAYAAPHAGTARQVFGPLLPRKNPALGRAIRGETPTKRQIRPLQQKHHPIPNPSPAPPAPHTPNT